MGIKISKMFQVIICAVLVFQLSGCGTLLYPERKGQRDGRIDIGVALLDGVGLLFFLVPGVIAFAVDFSNGTIYLPGTARSSLNVKTIKQAKFDSKRSSLAEIERIIKDQTGKSVKLNEPDMQVSRLASVNDMVVQFAQVASTIQETRIALNTSKGDIK